VDGVLMGAGSLWLSHTLPLINRTSLLCMVKTKDDWGWGGHKIRDLGACSGQVPPLKLGMSSPIHAWALTIINHEVKVIVNLNMHRS